MQVPEGAWPQEGGTKRLGPGKDQDPGITRTVAGVAWGGNQQPDTIS